jgi:TolB-like protein/cytochrome c-type biogenesis protein CcmH/NrfG
MTTEALKRKLTAILSADVKGYSRLMGEDEEATVRTLTSYREIMSSLINQHRGRVVDSPGDNVLAEFASVVDAVQGAVEIQQALKARNAELPENRKMEFRIGINLGDVIEEGERIYGDGVNIAARVENLCTGGGICISISAYDQVETKLPLDYEYLGEHSVKNIPKPIRVYQVRAGEEAEISKVESGREAIVSTKPDRSGMPEKPSIAVLPFVNMSADPEQEYFSDGLTEDLITDLSRISSLFVIARNSVFTYKGRAVKVEEVSNELGVRYVVEGSVRKAGNRVRITAQLVDARSGGHLWAERYDRDLGDIFALQDEVTQEIVSTLAVKLTADERKSMASAPTDNVEAYDYRLRGSEYFARATKEANAQARQMYEKAIELDPGFSIAYVDLGWTYVSDWTFQWSQEPQALEKASELAQKALLLNDSLPGAYLLLGSVCAWRKEYDDGVTALEKALTLDPNDAESYAALARIYAFSGKPKDALGFMEKAIRLNPAHPSWYSNVLGMAYFTMEADDKATMAFKQAVHLNPNLLPPHIFLAAIHSRRGNNEAARTEVAEVLRISPDCTSERFAEFFPIGDQAIMAQVLDSLRKAGLR